MSAVLDDHELRAWHQAGYLLVKRERRQRILTTAEDERRAGDAAEILAPVGSAHDRFLLTQERLIADPLRHAHDDLGERFVLMPRRVNEQWQQPRCDTPEVALLGELDEAAPARRLLGRIGPHGGVQERQL